MDELLFTIDTKTDDMYTQIIKTNYNDRKIVINQDICDDIIEDVSLMILRYNKEDINIPVDKRKKIYIYVNSDGGDVIMGNNALDLIKTSKTPVVTVGFAKCASMASYILAAGHERYCFPSTIVLLHDGQTGYVSSGNKGKDIQEFYNKIDKRQTQFMVDNTKMTLEFLEQIKDREYYVFADEAKELGLVDKIIGVDCSIEEIL